MTDRDAVLAELALQAARSAANRDEKVEHLNRAAEHAARSERARADWAVIE